MEFAPRRADALRSLRLLDVERGTRDQFNTHVGSRILSRRLAPSTVPQVREEFD